MKLTDNRDISLKNDFKDHSCKSVKIIKIINCKLEQGTLLLVLVSRGDNCVGTNGFELCAGISMRIAQRYRSSVVISSVEAVIKLSIRNTHKTQTHETLIV